VKLLLLLLLPLSATAQDLVISVSDLLRYGTGTETVGSLSRRRDYFENVADMRLGYGEFTAGLRLLADRPPEYGVEGDGVRNLFAEFRRGALAIRAGTSYSLFGRGLALNLLEDRTLAFDTGLNGIRAEYKGPVFRAMLTGGDILWRDNVTLARVERYRIRAGTFEWAPSKAARLGVSFVAGDVSQSEPLSFVPATRFDMPEVSGSISVGGIDAIVTYAERRTAATAGSGGTHVGHGAYASVSTGSGPFSAVLEYKDYRFGTADPYDRLDGARVTRAFAFQNPPIVQKQHTFTLLSRHPHVVDFSDETGLQIDAFYTVPGELTASVNASAASRHRAYQATGARNAAFLPVFACVDRSADFWPSLDDELAPFWELYGDVQYFWDASGNAYVHAGLNRRSLTSVDELSGADRGITTVAQTRLTAIPLEVQCPLTEDWILAASIEQEWVHEEDLGPDADHRNTLVSAGLSWGPAYAVTFRYEWTTSHSTVDGRRDWFAVDMTGRITESHVVTLMAGADRGGQICSNGICRVVNPFSGVRFSLLSYF
jgi:hypothetical protein